MTSLANAVIDTLRAASAVAAIATGGILDGTLTRDANPTSFGSVPGALIKPTLIVRDGGGGGDPFGPPAARLDYLTVTGFAPDTTQHRAVLDDLMQKVEAALFRWQKADTRETLGDNTRTEPVAAPFEKAVQVQLRFTVHGTLVGVTP